MERTMSVEDKIRRAEEIYYRRKEKEVPIKENTQKNKKEKKDIKLFRKMIKQIIVCLIIYGVYNIIVNGNYIFSEDFTNKVKEILNQDINIMEMYSTISGKIIEVMNKINTDDIQNDNEPEQQLTNNETTETQTQDIQNNDENIGGAEEVLTNETEIEKKPVLSQMEQDANYIKSSISFIKPVNGVISSMYGERNPTTPTVPKNHTGTDIAAVTGTKIISATDGTVILASSKGDYGKHLKIKINDVILVYAHCNKLYVKEGESIVQGQEIAEVGSTGNTTGPHLHFEVRYQDRYVNPQMILDL